MARTASPEKKKANKEPGRFRQMWQVFQMTRRYDKNAVWYMALGFAVPVAVGLTAGLILNSDSIFGLVLWIVAGVMGGFLAFLIILGRRAEKAAYSQIEGKPGAVGSVLKSSLRRGWIASEMPIAVNGKTQDAVYRAIGRGGIVLIGEGPKTRTAKMVDEERRRVGRILPHVPVNTLHVGPDDDAIPLHKLARRLRKFKNKLSKAEVLAISNRMSSLGKNGLPIPKGIDPFKARAPRPR
jgi:hypothetical protein